MSDTGQELPLNFLKSADSVIRNQSLGAATSLIDYRSAGQCLLIAPVETAMALVESLAPLTVTILEIDSAIDSGQRPVKRLTEEGVAVYSSGRPTITGHLGAFAVTVSEGDRTHDLAVMQLLETGCFDVILDTTSPALISARLPPLGYRSVLDHGQLPAVAAELAELIGDFDKPRYFDYNVEICAHQRSRLSGCSNCVDICATNAIRSAGEGVEVDPYLCQGCGSCATVCPSGAMTYAYPRVSDAIQRTREMREKHAGNSTVLLLYRQTDEDADVQFEETLPAHVLPVAVEEVTAFGLDYWAAMLAAGFTHIVVRVQVKGSAPAVDAAAVQEALDRDPEVLALRHQATLLHAVLGGMELDNCQVIVLSEDEDLLASLKPLDAPARESLPAFATHNNKRQTFRMAIDLLAKDHIPAQGSVTLPAQSAFGRIAVNRDACTLCMACVSTCPAGALLDGQDLPKLRFIESNCVQCGLCEQACPEQAIELKPMYSYDSVIAREVTILNEEDPFNCVRCHKPFATRKMIDTMSAKLEGHWMFGDEKAVRRLKMCEDCRVADIFEADAAGIQVHRDD